MNGNGSSSSDPGQTDFGGGGDFSSGGSVSSTDKFGSASADTFQTSDLNQPSSRAEGWRSLSLKMQPSAGPGSGKIDAKSLNNDAQWIRTFSLIVYKGGFGTQGVSGQVPSLDPNHPAPSRAHIPHHRWWARGDSRSPQWWGRNVVPFLHPSLRDDPAVSSTDSGGNAPRAVPATTDQSGLDISNLRCTFSIQKKTLRTPNILYARVYNLAPATLAKVIEFTRVQVSAGYLYANTGIIFDGTVVQYRRGKENPTDTYIEIHAADGDTGDAAILFKAWPKGTKERQKLDDGNAAKKKVDNNFKVTHIDDKLYQTPTQRDHVFAGDVRNLERRLAQSSNATHFTDDGGFIALSMEGYLPGVDVILSPQTGLIGLPEATPQGIQARCLLNPKLKLGGVVQINSNIISQVAFEPGTQSKTDAQGNVIPGDPTGGVVRSPVLQPSKQTFETAFTSPTGRYKILLMTYSGDTRGNPWYCDLVCIALDSKGSVILEKDGRVNTSNVWYRRASGDAKGSTPVSSTGTF